MQLGVNLGKMAYNAKKEHQIAAATQLRYSSEKAASEAQVGAGVRVRVGLVVVGP